MSEALIPLRLLIASIVVFVLPGVSLLRLIRERHARAEAPPLAFGLSIVVTTLLTISWIELGFGLRSMAFALLVVGALGFVAPRARALGALPPDEEPVPILGWLGLAALAITAVVFYRIGGTLKAAPTGEEVLHLAIVRKLWGQSSLSTHKLMYMADTPTTYVYAPYHAMVALVATIAGVDPLVAFVRLRGFFAAMAVLTMTGIVQLATRRIEGAVVGLWVFLGLLWCSVAGQVVRADGVALYWARLAPLSHLGDFALGIMLPLCVFFALRYLGYEDSPLVSWRLGGAVLVLAAATVIHVRETLQVLLYLGCFAAGAWLWRSWRLLGRTLLLGSAIVAVGLVYKVRHDALVGHVAMHEEANKQMVLATVERVLAQPAAGLFADVAYFRDEKMLFGALPALFLVAGPLLLAWRREPWAVLCSSVLVGFFVMFRVPVLSYLYVKFSYSEALATPLRNIDIFCLLLVAVATYAAVASLDRLRQEGIALWFAWLWLLAAAVFVWLGLGAGLQRLADVWQDGFLAVWMLSCLAAVLWARRRGSQELPRIGSPLQLGWRAVAVLASQLACLPLVAAAPPLLDQWRAARDRPPVERERDWYSRVGKGAQLPYRMLTAVRGLPDCPVVAVDSRIGLELAMLANVYVPSSGVGFSSDVGRFVDILRDLRQEAPDFGSDPWRAYLARSEYYQKTLATAPPLFSRGYSDAQQIEFLRLVGAGYLLYRIDESPHLVELVRRQSGLFKHVLSVGLFQLWQFVPAGASEAASGAR